MPHYRPQKPGPPPDQDDDLDEAPKRKSGLRLYLVRHGIAIDREDPDCPAESERYLTPKGMQRTRVAARGLRALRVKPDVLLTSPYVRAVQTGEIVCGVLGLDENQLRAVDSLKPDAKPSRLLEDLSRIGTGEVICFGHAPQLDDFIAYATKSAAAFTALKKSGVACLDVEDFAPLRATLFWLLTPRALRRLRG